MYRAQETAREYQAQLRAEAAAQRAVRSAGRPKGRGAAVRGEHVDCAKCREAGATPEESFLIHNDPDPVPLPPSGPADAEWSQPVAERHQDDYFQPEIVRGVDDAIVSVR